MFGDLKTMFREFNEDQRGEMPIGPLLIIALIVIPLVFLLILFRDEVVTFFTEAMENLFGTAEPGNEPTAPDLGN